jgi:hypothetical protein
LNIFNTLFSNLLLNIEILVSVADDEWQKKKVQLENEEKMKREATEIALAQQYINFL